MPVDTAGRRPASWAMVRFGLLGFALLVGPALTACTTVEGTNAMTDVGTFEREVMTETLAGVGMLDREKKEETANRRGPLVLPKDARNLPPPVADSETAKLPQDSNTVQINTAGLSEADLKRLRNARVVDPRTTAGRPLTPEETKKLTARMSAAQVRSGPRPLYLPPEEYFTTVGGRDLVCLAKNGDLVPLNDKACPPEIRKALQSTRAVTPESGGMIGSGADVGFTKSDHLND